MNSAKAKAWETPALTAPLRRVRTPSARTPVKGSARVASLHRSFSLFNKCSCSGCHVLGHTNCFRSTGWPSTHTPGKEVRSWPSVSRRRAEARAVGCLVWSSSSQSAPERPPWCPGPRSGWSSCPWLFLVRTQLMQARLRPGPSEPGTRSNHRAFPSRCSGPHLTPDQRVTGTWEDHAWGCSGNPPCTSPRTH